MTYMYDILLNFTDSKRIYDFFEWDCNDEILNIKKISIFKVSKKTLLDIYNYKVKIDDNFLKKIENTAIIYKQSKRKYKYLTILSDGNKAIGICINDRGIIEFKSFLLLQEEEEACFIVNKLIDLDLKYKRLEKVKSFQFITRKEEFTRNFLLKEINELYKNNCFEKLKYLYIEYFDRKEDNIEYIYNELIKSLNNINDKHLNIYNLLKLTCKK